MGPRRAEKVQRDITGNFARGLDFLFSFCSSESPALEVTHDRRETARSDPALEPAQEGRGPGRRRTPHPDPRMLLGEGQRGEGPREARGLSVPARGDDELM